MSGCIQRSGDTHSYGETWKQDEKKFKIRCSVEFSCAAARCIPWRVDGHSNGEACRKKKKSGNLDLSESETWSQEEAVTGNPWLIKQLRWNPMHPVNQTTRKIWKLKEQNGHMSPGTVHHMEAVISIVREIYGPEADDLVDDLDLNMAFLKHISEYHSKTVRRIYDSWRIIFCNSEEQLFNETGKLISEQTEITGVNTMNLQRTYVDVHKLLAQQSLSDHQRQNLRLLLLSALRGEKWETIQLQPGWTKLKRYSEKQSLQGYESNRRNADGVRVDNFPRNHSVGPPRDDSKMNDRSTVWTWAFQRQDHLHVCSQIPSRSLVYLDGNHTDRPDGSWDQIAEIMMSNFSDSGLPIFRSSSAFERGELRIKEHGTKSIHFNGSDENIELLLRTLISANQLSVCGATADLCSELSIFWASGKHLIIWKRWRFLPALVLQKLIPLHSNGETLCKKTSEKSKKLSEDQKLSILCSDAGLKLLDQGQYFYTVYTEEGQEMQHLCREYTLPRNEKKTPAKGWILKNTRIAPFWNIKGCHREDRYSFRFWPSLCFKTEPLLGLESWMVLMSTWQNGC